MPKQNWRKVMVIGSDRLLSGKLLSLIMPVPRPAGLYVKKDSNATG